MEDWEEFLPHEPTLREMAQFGGFHLAECKDLKNDIGQSRWEVENLLSGGDEKTWTNPAPVMGCQISGSEQKLASGFWWPPQPGDHGIVGFLEHDPMQPFIIPGLVRSTKPQEGNGILPGEIKTLSQKSDPRAMTRAYKISTPAGSGEFWDDNAGKEAGFVGDYTGAGIYWANPGKGQDPQEGQYSQSIPRQQYTRQDDSVAAQTSKPPGQILKNGEGLLGMLDLNGSGIMMYCSDGGGSLVIQASNGNGQTSGPSIVIDAKNNRIILTAGSAQFVINGAKGLVETPGQVVQEQVKVEVEPTIQKYKNDLKSVFSYYTGGSGGSATG
jgi:hypothetical protein